MNYSIIFKEISFYPETSISIFLSCYFILQIRTNALGIIKNLPGCHRQLHSHLDRKNKNKTLNSSLLHRDSLIWKRTLNDKTVGGIFSSSFISSRLASTESGSATSNVTDGVSEVNYK